jgi:hypothetical protein
MFIAIGKSGEVIGRKIESGDDQKLGKWRSLNRPTDQQMDSALLGQRSDNANEKCLT